ncbi:TIGR01777 family oxidoreductase [Domibacillus sp. DTU_2020_1001157_1_SI_ALB_TIR_016]|uniref:TIGR01777 family oxidoreductase n=1 Tax=Domibacillus sp. DTU_2020_1001157_1_SI_ALB_TIR_016 TaxID=3077789 RepID=UPI0028EA4CEC|nr:TIGR01777 family oxidoreductase [Domibacillus sp. DTU_2020_1001157_1_SI_ALB_TIR_016]WNS80151.1 TIGR01777 family oxidoreductase [Domibacillus sp. DTU_2020_1001157_1_SI_ALB_TIR_016]
MKTVIAGGTGFVGKELTNELIRHGYDVTILTRNPENKKEEDCLHYVKWLADGAEPEAVLEGTDVFINLAGESINSRRWTEERKQRILNSRITATREMVRIMKALKQKPKVFINASAVGIYPSSDMDTFTESSNAAGSGFLSQVVNIWEREAIEADKAGIRTVLARFGVVLGTEEGALPRMALPYKIGAGGKLGSGQQWVSWIHVWDVARAIRFAAEHEAIEGPMNITAPNPVRMNDLGKTLAKVLGRPHWLFVPEPALKLTLGEMSTVVLDGQRVLPDKLTQAGFVFQFPLLRGALNDLYPN